MPDTQQLTDEEKIAKLQSHFKEREASKPAPATSTTTTAPPAKSPPAKKPWDPTHLCFGILFYAVLIIGLTAFLIYKKKISAPIHDNQWFVRVLVVPMCIVAAVFLTIAGYDQQQIAPVVGLLGTIIGYLLGSAPRQSGGPTQNNTDGAGI